MISSCFTAKARLTRLYACLYDLRHTKHRALGPSPSRAQQSGGTKNESASVSGKSAGNDSGGQRATAWTSSVAIAAAAAAEEEGEVRPYPGVVDGLDDLLADDDDQLVSIFCGARYTLAVSRKKRPFVWGQVAPAKDVQPGGGGEYDDGGGSLPRTADSGKGTARRGDDRVPSSSPIELRPGDLLRGAGASARAAAGGSREIAGGGERCMCCGVAGGSAAVESNGGVLEKSAAADMAAFADSDWRVSTVGCGPWYVVLCLEESKRR